MTNINKEIIEKIINGDFEILNKYAQEIGEKYAPQNPREKEEKLTTSQIRNILDDVQRMKEEDIKSQKHQILRPKLAYIAGRNNKSFALKELKEIIDYALQLVGDDYKKFENFRYFFEAIVGYHRFYSKVKD
ncbi:MAG TPA: type III-A CRISPR-associated protein Csm2 [bacterium]|nr:type III-A CRISPR-associated protein Csm2 [bacterium]HOM27667.1 type III-A CRISPR-associated protein Csm2 [bacterium]